MTPALNERSTVRIAGPPQRIVPRINGPFEAPEAWTDARIWRPIARRLRCSIHGQQVVRDVLRSLADWLYERRVAPSSATNALNCGESYALITGVVV